MDTIQAVFMFVWNHYDLFLTLLGAILAIVRVTAWGAANAKALQVVTGAIELMSGKGSESGPARAATSATEIKQAVASEERKLPAAVADALRDAVAVVDPAKTPATPMQRFVRELLRTPGKPTA